MISSPRLTYRGVALVRAAATSLPLSLAPDGGCHALSRDEPAERMGVALRPTTCRAAPCAWVEARGMARSRANPGDDGRVSKRGRGPPKRSQFTARWLT